MRVLGVDLGKVRTGLSISDAAGITCRPLEVLEVKDREILADRIIAVAEREGAEKIVVGLPRPLGGGRNPQLEASEAFVAKLRQRGAVSIATWDERFTTTLARRSARGGSETGIDALAACHLLQGYLESCGREEGPDAHGGG